MDDCDAASWLGSGVAADCLWEPLLQAYFFQPLAGTSRALPWALAAHGARGPKTMGLPIGVVALPRAVAAGLDIRLGAAVQRLDVGADSVTVATSAGDLLGDYCIVAATAPAARDLLGTQATPAESALLATGYSATVTVALGLHRSYRLPNRLADVHGVSIPRRERRNVSAVAVESNKTSGWTGPGPLLLAFLAGEAGGRLLGESDPLLTDLVLEELEPYFPGVTSAVTLTHVTRWSQTEPLSPVGRAKAVAAYRAGWIATRRVLLAGDYTGLPWTDSAAASGQWAAERLRRRVA
ncbi:MAG: FAD-dependent oxidoreductase [Propionibacteriaceae bacterium]|nr:FAD-dependent oxidoreductase [Propionibacteriaceae bacterium]